MTQLQPNELVETLAGNCSMCRSGRSFIRPRPICLLLETIISSICSLSLLLIYNRPQCEEIDYDLTTFATKWPSSVYWPVFADKYDITYHNVSVNEDISIEYLLNQSMHTPETMEAITRLQDYVTTNFLRVEVTK